MTPTTAQVLDAWVTAQALRRETFAQHYQGAPVPDYQAEFEEWYAGEIERAYLNGWDSCERAWEDSEGYI